MGTCVVSLARNPTKFGVMHRAINESLHRTSCKDEQILKGVRLYEAKRVIESRWVDICHGTALQVGSMGAEEEEDVTSSGPLS